MPIYYRRSRLDFKCTFVTTSCHKHLPLLAYPNCYQHLATSINRYAAIYDTDILSYVLMPNHFHMLAYFKNENKLSDFMRDIKKQSSIVIRTELQNCDHFNVRKIKYRSREQYFKIWQDGFYDYPIYTSEILLQKLNYIHNNPLQDKWKLANDAASYKYSSAAFYEYLEPGLVNTEFFTKYFSAPIARKI